MKMEVTINLEEPGPSTIAIPPSVWTRVNGLWIMHAHSGPVLVLAYPDGRVELPHPFEYGGKWSWVVRHHGWWVKRKRA